MSSPKSAIVPHTKAKGIDMCGGGINPESNDCFHIIRSDLHCYMTYHSKERKYDISPLHPACSWGDHYLFAGLFYVIIKGNYFIMVSDLTNPSSTLYQPLAEVCQNGDNYMFDASQNGYIVIKGDTYTRVSSLSSPEDPTSEFLFSGFQNGLYYYYNNDGDNSCMNVITEVVDEEKTNWGTANWQIKDLKKGDVLYRWFAQPNLMNFLPGGFSITYGPATQGWQHLQCIDNSSKTTLHWSESITKTVGYKQSQFESLKKSWNVSTDLSIGTSFSSSFLVQASIQMQFSLSKSYGGASTQSNQADWSDESTTTQKISVEVPPKKSAHIWQFRMGFAGMPNSVLLCRDIAITNSEHPPQNIPLPTV